MVEQVQNTEQQQPIKIERMLNRPAIPGVDYKVRESAAAGRLAYGGLNNELRRLGFKTISYTRR